MAAIAELKERIRTFFRVQPFGQSVGLGEIYLDLKQDELKELVPNAEAEKVAKEVAKTGAKLPDKKADLIEFGRRAAVNDALDALKTDGIIKTIKLEGKGMGWKYDETRVEPAEEVKVRRIAIDQIRVDKSLQQRDDGIDQQTVEQYAEVADLLPPIRVFSYKNTEGQEVLLLSRGFHRIAAWRAASWDMVPCEVVKGSREEAILDAVGDNAAHGRRRTVKDIEKSIGTLLAMRGYRNASTALLASIAKCSWATADKYARNWRKANEKDDEPKETTRKGSDGKEYPASIKPSPVADAGPVPTTAAPVAAAPPPSPTGVKDHAGKDITDPDLARCFKDDRFTDALKGILANIRYLRELRPEGYAISSLNVKEREGILSGIENGIQTLQLSTPHCVCPSSPGKAFTTASRRGWMTQAEKIEFDKREPKAGEMPEVEANGKPVASQSEAAPATQGASNAAA